MISGLELNPGPNHFYWAQSLHLANNETTSNSSIFLQNKNWSAVNVTIQYAVNAVPTSNNPVSFTITGGGYEGSTALSFRSSVAGSVFTTPVMRLGPNIGNQLTFTATRTIIGVVTSFMIFVEALIEPGIPVDIVTPNPMNVYISNSDPLTIKVPDGTFLPVGGEVSISNPLPSVATTLLNAFK